MASQVYFEGDWYEAIQATSPGESPTTNPEKWQIILIPAMFRRYLIQSAYERLLPAGGQNDKRRSERVTASSILDDTYLREFGQDSSTRSLRSEVKTR